MFNTPQSFSFALNFTRMSSLRFKAIDNLTTTSDGMMPGAAKITAIFGENVFTLKTAREFLSDEAYKSLLASIKSGKKIDRAVANQIASGMRQWAESKGVTHFTHWFQPLTGTTAEKHDTFFTIKERWHRHRRIRRGCADPAGARRLLLPQRRSESNLRSPRLYRLGPFLPRICHGDRSRQNPLHPHHFR